MRQLVVDLGDTLRERTEAYVPAVDYPEDNNVASTLRQCAQLIDADLGVRALAVGADGYDTHANQNDGASSSSLGYHDYLLMQVSSAIGAFLADVAAHGHGSRVVVVVASVLGFVRARSEVAGRRLAVAGSIAVIVAGTFWFIQRVFFAGGLT